MAASSWVGVILKSFSIDVGTTTGKPPDNLQFQNSSPSKGLVKLLHHHHLTVMLYKDCFAPVETTICDGL
jgi:hypothetical protein